MVFGIVALIVLYILYQLLIKGLLWKLIFLIGGWAGIYIYLQNKPTFQSCPLTISSYNFSWAFIVPTVLVILVLGYTKDEG